MTDISDSAVAERLELIDTMVAMFDLAMRTEGIDYKVRQRISNRVLYGAPERVTYTAESMLPLTHADWQDMISREEADSED